MVRSTGQKFAPNNFASHAGWMFVGQGMGYLLRAGVFGIDAQVAGRAPVRQVPWWARSRWSV